MSGVISKQIIEDIRARNDIVEVIGAHLPLKRAGSSYKALCPFHREKTPSFHVHAQKQIFRCYGCNEGGDVFQFIQRFENVDFPMAAQILAERAGIQLEFEGGGSSQGPDSDKKTLYALLEKLARLYNQALRESKSARVAREYLDSRSLSNDHIESYLIGFAPEGYDTLTHWSGKTDFTIKHLELTGMIGTNDHGQTYDRFRNRIIFPIRDEMGRVIGFSGRALDEEKQPAKYINSPETVLFRKSRVLYGVDQARKALTEERRAILCEGQIDVIRCQTSGLVNAVAPQGTALTEDHARLLKRYVDTVTLVFDADNAGRKAALRSGEVLIANGLLVEMAALPEKEDPDSIILHQGTGPFRQIVESASGIIDFQMDYLSTTNDLSTEQGRLHVVKEVTGLISRIPGEVQKEEMVRKAATRLGISDGALRKDMQQLSRGNTTYAGPASDEEVSIVAIDHPIEEVSLLELLLMKPELEPLITRFIDPQRDIKDPTCKTIMTRYLALAERDQTALLNELSGDDPACQRLLAQVQLTPRIRESEETVPETAAQELILRIRGKELENRRNALRQQVLKAAESEKNRIIQECAEITQDLHVFRQGWDKAAPILELHD